MAVLGCSSHDLVLPEADPLEYSRSVSLEGLGESVRVVKTPTHVYAVLADGTVASYPALVKRNRQVLRQRYGAGSPELHARLASAADDERIRVAIIYRLPELAALIEIPAAQRSSLVEAAIESRGAHLLASLTEAGFEASYQSHGMPALFGTMPAEALTSVLHDERLARVFEDVRRPAPEYAAWDAATEHSVDATWNYCADCLPGNFGDGVPIGLIEPCAVDPVGHGGAVVRGIFDEHHAFRALTPGPAGELVTYQAPLSTCTTDSDCFGDPKVEFSCYNDPSLPDDDAVRCINDRCVGTHGSRVASVISSETGGPVALLSSAAKARLYYPNAKKIDRVAHHAAAFDWLHAESGGTVKTVNESHGFGGPQTSDWWSRVHGVTSVRAAGNSVEVVACEMTANSLCVGAATHQEQLNVNSARFNPPGAANPPDREEPDFVAFGGDGASDHVRTLGFAGVTDWVGEKSGTSYSAAITTSMVAHLRHACAVHGFLVPIHVRAILRNAAWSANPANWVYSTPSNVFDHFDGGGWPAAPALEWLCAGGDDTSGVIWVDLTEGNPPPGGSTSVDHYTPGLEPQGARPLNYAPPHQNLNRREYYLDTTYLNVGDRVRYTITWEACATGDNDDPIDVDIDLDLFLYNIDAKHYVYGSQSFDDNNEGFDLEITAAHQAGNYRIVYSRPANQTDDCDARGVWMSWAGRWGQW